MFVFFLFLKASCGVKPPGSRIVGGGVAQPHSWPWQLSLRRNSFHTCGASLISPQWAVTAGHCVSRTQDPKDYAVVAGNINEISTVSHVCKPINC